MIDIDAPLPEDAVQTDIIDVAPPPITPSAVLTSHQHRQPQSSLTSPASAAADGLADLPPLEQPSDVEHSPNAASNPSTASSSSAASLSSFSISSASGISFEPPVLSAPTTRFLDAFTPLKQPAPDSAAISPTAPLDTVASALRDQLSAYKRRKTEQSSARSQLNALVKRGGEDYIDLNPYSAMPSPQPPPVRPSSASTDRSASPQPSRLFAPWMVREYRHANFTLRLHEELLDFAAFISPTASEEKHRTALLARLSDLTTSLFPSSNLRPFGSYATKLYLPIGDIDCCLFGAPATALHQLHRALEREGWASYLEHITSARIPIVKFMDRSTGLRVDVCQDQTVGLEAAQYITQMSVKFPAFRPLLLFLKYYLHVRRLNDTYSGGVGSYLLQLMLLSHLHFHPAQTLDVNLGLLLLSFFDTYGHQLNYQNVGISLSPPSFYSKHDRQRFNPQRPLLLSVENPLDSSHDVGMNSFGVMRVRRAMQYAYGRLTERSVMEGRWEGSLLAMVLGVMDDQELRERGQKKEREREKRARREGGERKERDEFKEKEEREERRTKTEKKKRRKRVVEEEEGEIVVDDSEDERGVSEEKQADERHERGIDASVQEHKHDGEEQRQNKGKEQVPSEEYEGDMQFDEHKEPVVKAKAKGDSAMQAANQSVFASSSTVAASSSPTSSTTAKWHPGQPFPEKWLRLFIPRDVSVILEQLELNELARAEALKQFAREKEAWVKKQPTRLRDNEEEKDQEELTKLLRQKDEAVAKTDVAKLKREAVERYSSSWMADMPFPAEWLRLLKPSELSDVLDRRTELDDRTRRRLLLDFRRDKRDLLDRLKSGEQLAEQAVAPMTIETWQPGAPIPAEWLKQYSEKRVKQILGSRTDLGKKRRRRMLEQFKEEKERAKEQWGPAREKRVAKQMMEQSGLYEVEEKWLLMPRAQVDTLLQEREVSDQVRMTVLRRWKEALMSKTDKAERKRKTEAGRWTKQDEQEWFQWRRLQRHAKLDLAKQDGVEVFNVPSKWLQWDRQRVKELLKEWKIRGEVKDDVLRQWKEKQEKMVAGMDEAAWRKGEKKSDERLKEELRKLMLSKQQERKKDLQHAEADQNGTAAHHRAAMLDTDNRKRQREDMEADNQKQEEVASNEVDTQSVDSKEERKERVDSEPRVSLPPSAKSAPEPPASRREELRKKLRKTVQAEVLRRLTKQSGASERRPHAKLFPHTAADHKLYNAEWNKALDERVDAELAREAAQLSEGASQSAHAPDSPQLNQREKEKVRGQLQSAALKRWQVDEAAKGRVLSSMDMDYGKFNSEIDAEVDSKTAEEWRAILQANGGTAELEQEQQRSEVKRARKRVIERIRQQRRQEYEARGKTAPHRLDKLFPVSGSDQKLLNDELAAELDRMRNGTADRKANGDQHGEEEDGEQKTAPIASAAAVPEVIDLVDDDEPDDCASSAVRSAIGDDEDWAEETSARRKRRAVDDAPLVDMEVKSIADRESARASKRTKVDADRREAM